MRSKLMPRTILNIERCFHFLSTAKSREYLARRLVGFTSDQMYDVVADVKNYKDFVPFCKKSVILSEMPGQLEANLEVGFPPIYENYTSIVTLVKPYLVQAICRDGRIFNFLETTWKFSPGLESNRQSCIIEFYINFEFKSLMHSKVASLFFDRLVNQMEGAFLEEVKRRHGNESLPTHTLSVVKS